MSVDLALQVGKAAHTTVLRDDWTVTEYSAVGKHDATVQSFEYRVPRR